MKNKICVGPLHIRFHDCSSEAAAQSRLQDLKLGLNEWYSGTVQLFSSENTISDNDGYQTVTGRIGVRLDEYDPNTFSESPAQHGGETPNPWLIAIDVLTNLNALVDDISVFSRKGFINPTKVAELNSGELSEFDDDYVNEHAAIWIDINSHPYETPPEWVEGKASAVYHVGCKTYDLRDLGGTDPDVPLETVFSALVQKACSDILPEHLQGELPSDAPTITIKLPRSLCESWDNFSVWKESHFKQDNIHAVSEPCLGFRSHKDVYGSYEEI